MKANKEFKDSTAICKNCGKEFHLDGHSNNNGRSNLRLICPNCDSQLETFKSKNKHSDRTYRYANLAA